MTLEQLDALLARVSEGLADVGRKRMFGCQGHFAGDTIYGLVWKEGRLGLKLTDEAAFAELMAMPGAAPWVAGDRTIGGWVLVPERFHTDEATLRTWVERAHALALARPSAKAKKAPAKKPAPAKAAAAKKASPKTVAPAAEKAVAAKPAAAKKPTPRTRA